MKYREGYFMCPNHRTIVYGNEGKWRLVRKMCRGTGQCSVEDALTDNTPGDLDMGRYAMNQIAKTRQELTMYLLAE